MHASTDARISVKRLLARLDRPAVRVGTTILIYHRVGGGTADERDLDIASFTQQLDVLGDHAVVSLDDALDALVAGDDAPRVVLTFDDGFADVHSVAYPLLRERRLPFTVYLATAFVGGTMHWEGSTATAPGPALTWPQVVDLARSPLCTFGNHTHHHVPPDQLSTTELDRCSDALQRRTGVRPRHFAYPWGIPASPLEDDLRARFRSAVTGQVGRNRAGVDLLRLRRVPVRRTDPLEFFRAKLDGHLLPERLYAGAVSTAKRVGMRA